jgi:hypothetical protein
MMRLTPSTLWLIAPALLLLAVVLQLSPSGGTIQAAQPSALQAYAGNDPSVPAAASVQLPVEPAPQVETF